MKCVRCNKFMFDPVKLADGSICMKCFQELGFDKCMRSAFDSVPYEQIKNGADSYFEYCRKRDRLCEDAEETEAEDVPSFEFADVGEDRELNATAEEVKIQHIIYQCTRAEDMDFVRRSNNYVSVAIGPTDVARFKYTKRAKWIQLPYVLDDKMELERPDDVFYLKDDLIKAVSFARENQ